MFSEEFFLRYPPPTGQHHPTLLTPALRRPRIAPNYNHTVLPSALPSLQSLECSNPSSSASGHKTEVQLQYLCVPTQTCQRRIQIELLRLLDTHVGTHSRKPLLQTSSAVRALLTTVTKFPSCTGQNLWLSSQQRPVGVTQVRTQTMHNAS